MGICSGIYFRQRCALCFCGRGVEIFALEEYCHVTDRKKKFHYEKILIVSGHPNIDGDSVANKAALEEFQRLLPDAEIDRLDALYPDYKIDVEAEQAKLVAADTIVLQYPVFWYGMPALLQKWVEDVFAHGFSHGSKGKALVGKNLILSMTLEAPDEAYGEDAAVRLDDLLPPAKGMCAASGMNFSGWEHCDYVTYATRVNEEACDAIAERACKLAGRVVERIRGL